MFYLTKSRISPAAMICFSFIAGENFPLLPRKFSGFFNVLPDKEQNIPGSRDMLLVHGDVLVSHGLQLLGRFQAQRCPEGIAQWSDQGSRFDSRNRKREKKEEVLRKLKCGVHTLSLYCKSSVGMQSTGSIPNFIRAINKT